MASTIHDPENLTSHQQEVIVAAMEDRGRFEVACRADTRGKAVRTKTAKFFDADDQACARAYIDAVRQLERLLFVREAGKRNQYELTNFGWLIGRKLIQDRKHSQQGDA